MTSQAETVTEQVVPSKKRGRETGLDMVRSLGLVLVVVIAAWWLAQPNDEDTQAIRAVDSRGSVASVLREHPGTPVPAATPAGWTPTVDAAEPDGLRLGYVTADRQYVEYALSLGGRPDFLSELTGKGTEVGTFEIDGTTWRQFTSAKGDATSLVRTVGSATVLVGGVRETARLEDLRVLAAAVRP